MLLSGKKTTEVVTTDEYKLDGLWSRWEFLYSFLAGNVR